MATAAATVTEETQARELVLPYWDNQEAFPKDFLDQLFDHIVEDRLMGELFHERPVSRNEFVALVGNPQTTVLSVFIDTVRHGYAGIAWLTELAFMETHERAVVAFGFFRNFWEPKQTRRFGRICLSQWFNLMGFDLLYGMTPKLNRVAQRFSKAMGFRYVATLPEFTCYQGKRCDALVCQQTREEFNMRLKDGKVGIEKS